MEPDAYLQKLEAAFTAAVNAGMIDYHRVYSARVEHDAWCPFLLKTGPCACDPSIYIEAGRENNDDSR